MRGRAWPGHVEPAADILGISEHPAELLIRRLRLGELVKFHFVELVPSLDPPGVFARRHLFPAEAGGVSNIIYWQGPRRYDFIAVEVGQRHLGSGYEPEIILFIMVEVIGEFGQLA
jgi:hypothetical protein